MPSYVKYCVTKWLGEKGKLRGKRKAKIKEVEMNRGLSDEGYLLSFALWMEATLVRHAGQMTRAG